MSKDNKPKKRYEKNPVKQRVNTVELYSKYKSDQQNLTVARAAELQQMRIRKDRAIAAAKRNSKLRRATIKIVDGKGVDKRILYSQANTALRASLTAIAKEFKAEKDKLQNKYQRRTWADWLRQKAIDGDLKALEALRARDAAQGLKGNTINAGLGGFKKMSQKADLPLDGITKKGTIIYRSGRNAIRDDGDKLQVSRSANLEGLEAALKLAIERFGGKIAVNGTAEFKAQIIHIAVKTNLPVTFTDAGLERLRQQQLMKENPNEQPNRGRRPDSSGIGRVGRRPVTDNDSARSTARRPAGRLPGAGLLPGLRKPNVKAIGRNPPPESQNRLRGMSQCGVVQLASGTEMLLPRDVPRQLEHQGAKPDNSLRRNVFGPGSGIAADHLAAAKKYIQEREQKRVNGFGIPNHSLYNGDGANITFAGVRNIEGHALALLKQADGSIEVLPIDKATAQRLSKTKIDEPVTVTARGSIKTTRGRSL